MRKNTKRGKSRNLILDISKSFAIVFVLIGHSIQYGSGTEYYNYSMYFDNKLFLSIYSFHMALFMLISGFLLFNTLQKHNVKNVILNKIKILISPIFFGSFLPLAININKLIQQNAQINLKVVIFNYLSIFFNNLGFLGAIFGLTLIVLIGNKIFKDNLIFYILVYLVFFITPDNLVLNTNLHLYKFSYFFFILAYLFNKYKFQLKLKKIYDIKIILPILLCLYVLLYIGFDKQMLIYISGFSVIGKNVLKQVYVDLYRNLIGLIGSACIIIISNIICLKLKKYISKPFTNLGKNTLGIYIISTQIYTYILPKFTYMIGNFSYMIVFAESLMILIISLLLIFLINNFNKLIIGNGN